MPEGWFLVFSICRKNYLFVLVVVFPHIQAGRIVPSLILFGLLVAFLKQLTQQFLYVLIIRAFAFVVFVTGVFIAIEFVVFLFFVVHELQL